VNARYGLPEHALWADSAWGLLEARVAATPDARFALDEAGESLTFGAYAARAERVAAGLAARGVGVGTPVSWILPTTLDALVLSAALFRLGAVQNPILPIYREREVAFVTGQTDARWLFVPSTWRGFDYAGMGRALSRDRSNLELVCVDDGLPEGDPASLAPFAEPTDDPVRWHFYTSGTTSDPKGARHSDRTLLPQAAALVRCLDLRGDDRHGFVFPFTHVGGVGWLLASFMGGFSHLLVAAFDPEATARFLSREGVTQAGAGTVFHQAYLAAQRATSSALFPEVRSFPGGGAPKPPALHQDLKRELGGVGIVSGYGLTECPIIAMNTVRCSDDKLAHTEGRVNPPDAEIRVITLEGRVAEPGEEGELRLRGPQLCKGYVDAALDAEAFDPDGFFRSGDLGFLDAEGYVVITGRRKDVIIRKGENISAKEVEDLLYTHPAVADVAVVGLPDAALGERCCAVVACEPGATLEFEAMVAFLKDAGLMLQKIPEQLELLAELPRNAAGKLQKQALRQRFG
jgi:acyl-CoA synthetase (AMP-forming)/AMP-acid ligase II